MVGHDRGHRGPAGLVVGLGQRLGQRGPSVGRLGVEDGLGWALGQVHGGEVGHGPRLGRWGPGHDRRTKAANWSGWLVWAPWPESSMTMQLAVGHLLGQPARRLLVVGLGPGAVAGHAPAPSPAAGS